MSFLGLLGGALSAASDVSSRSLSPYRVSIAPSFAAIHALRASSADTTTPFQDEQWLDAWSATLGREPGIEMFSAMVRNGDGTTIMALPLVRQSKGLLRSITFADGGVTDYNVPVVTAQAPTNRFEAKQIWLALLRDLPRADLVRLERMPFTVGTRSNPLANVAGACLARGRGSVLSMPDAYADWLKALPRRYRMEIGRCARIFEAIPGARFHRAGADEGRVLAALERMQRERITDLALPYVLDHAPIRDFYRALVDDLDSGIAVLTALSVGDEVIAALLGVRRGDRFVMLRIGTAGGPYTRLSPSRLLILRTMEMLRPDGVRHFDFGLGDYTYKRKLGGTPVPLCDLVAANSPLGVPEAASHRLKARLRASPRVRQMAVRVGLVSPNRAEPRPQGMPRFGPKAGA